MKKPEINNISEFDMIRALEEKTSITREDFVRVGIGDDCAVLEGNLLVTKDLLLEGIHFDPGLQDWRSVGCRAMNASLSDIAAMGGEPLAAVLGIGLPGEGRGRIFDEITDGILDVAKKYGADLIGGDTVRSIQGVALSITMIGRAPFGGPVLRSGASPGDLLFVTGSLGESVAGLDILKAGLGDEIRRRGLVDRFRNGLCRVEAGREIATRCAAKAMIDVSDGLASDIRRICERSEVGAEIVLESLPIADETYAAAGALGVDPLDWVLYGGEDFELLFAVTPGIGERPASALAELKIDVTEIGRFTEKREILLVSQGKKSIPLLGGFDHFFRS